MSTRRRRVPSKGDTDTDTDTDTEAEQPSVQEGCDSLEVWRARAPTGPQRRLRSATMDLDIVTYVFQGPEGTFSIKPRLSRRWRVKHNSIPWGDSFASAEEAAVALSKVFDVPADLKAWTEVGDFHTDVGGLLP